MKKSLAILVGSFVIGLISSVTGAELVINGDFEKDVDDFNTWPGYVGQADNPAEVPDWFGTGGRGINPVTVARNPSEIPFWLGDGGRGINPVLDGNDPPPRPFNDNGDNETAIAFMQGASSIQQDINGLAAGTNYLLTFDFNARVCCGDFPVPGLSLNGDFITEFPDEDLFIDGIVESAGLENEFIEWYQAEIPYTADGTDLNILFTSEPSAGGDATFLLDNISLVAEGGGDNLVLNGDFETDAETFTVWPGYVGGGGQPPAPFNDNGNNDTAIAFMQGAAFLEQEVTGFVTGEEYTLSLDFNSRNCCGDVPVAELYIDDELVEDFPGDDFDFGVVLPVGDEEPWYQYETTFVADKDSYFVRIATFAEAGADSTLIIDNVSVRSQSTPGDFDGDGQLGVEDITALTNAIKAGESPAEMDLNSDGNVDQADRTVWVKDLKKTFFGDANLDGEFSSADFVSVFQRGEYEDELAGNSDWSDGDWNGDCEFNSSDFVIAFQDGGFEQGPMGAVSSVPEPSQLTWFGIVIVAVIRWRRRSMGK